MKTKTRLEPSDNYRVSVKLATFAMVRERDRLASAPLDAPERAAGLLRSLIPDDAREHFYILMLNSQNQLVAAHHVSTGSLSASIVHPREVLGPALRLLGVAHLILGHNHPSGDPTPSKEDIHLTRQLVEGARLLGLRVHDHVIVGSGSDAHVSLAARGLV
jgi:DNA repair protein RadC